MRIINNSHRHVDCPCCHSNKVKLISTVNYKSPISFSTSLVELTNLPELWKCINCESGFIQNFILEKDAQELYSSGESNVRWSSVTFEEAKPKGVTDALTRLLTVNSKVLDVGCAKGDFLDFAKSKGCSTYGLEYSTSSLDVIKANGHFAYSRLEDINQKFDLITAFDVVEHLYDINNFIDVFMEKLSPGGCIVAVTGDISCLSARISRGRWWYVSYPEHILFPSIKYFVSHPKVSSVKSIKTYSNRRHEMISLLVISIPINIIRYLQGKLLGSPPIDRDHYLIMLYRD